MTQSLLKLLDDRKADSDTIQQAMRSYVSAQTGFMSEADMYSQMVAAVGDKAAVDRQLEALRRDASVLEAAALVVLSAAASEPRLLDEVRVAIDGAKTKMPVIEVGILAIVAMYGMYLHVTKGIKSTDEVIKRDESGRFERTRSTTYFGPTGPLSTMAGLFTPKQASRRDPTD